ncbi:putative mitochondrial protein [Cucumis melo var. makuwa]|uniref:Putative mitochondrial protein n=1 Tax=Cucumis melo var. makuwa TaxID=1194695 RepID=A0A5D3CUE3_CUCMM|nr:putative mitochondrial protein [Cucumis melo var. makuwa]
MENSTESCTSNKMSENDKSDVAVVENVEKKNNGDEIEVRARTSTRSTKHLICNYVSYDNLSPQFIAFTASLDSTIISKNIYTALKCPKWKNVVLHKVRLVAKGFTQTYGVDYSETFSPVAKMNIVGSPAICCCE